MKIELVDHVGTNRRGEPVSHNQFIVVADGQYVGYLGKGDNPWLACIVSMDEETQVELRAAIDKLLKGNVAVVSMAPEPDDEQQQNLIEDDEE